MAQKPNTPVSESPTPRAKKRHKPNKRKETKTVFTDKYELPMHEHVRWQYAECSDWHLNHWRLTAFMAAQQTARDQPQVAVSQAAATFAAAVNAAAEQALATKQVPVQSQKHKARRRPSFWNPDLQVLSRISTQTKRDLVSAIHMGADLEEVAELRHRVINADNSLYDAIRTHQHTNSRQRAQQIEEDLAHAGTEATNYQGGGGYLKRAWDYLKRPLIQAQRARGQIPLDVMNTEGEPASTATEGARNWKIHGEGLGKFNPEDPKYDIDKTMSVINELSDITRRERAQQAAEAVAISSLEPGYDVAEADDEEIPDPQAIPTPRLSALLEKTAQAQRQQPPQLDKTNGPLARHN